MDEKVLDASESPEAQTPDSEKKTGANIQLESVDLTRVMQIPPEEQFEWSEVKRGMSNAHQV